MGVVVGGIEASDQLKLEGQGLGGGGGRNLLTVFVKILPETVCHQLERNVDADERMIEFCCLDVGKAPLRHRNRTKIPKWHN